MKREDDENLDLPRDLLKTTLPIRGVSRREQTGKVSATDPFEHMKMRMKAWEAQRQLQASRRWNKVFNKELSSDKSDEVI